MFRRALQTVMVAAALVVLSACATDDGGAERSIDDPLPARSAEDAVNDEWVLVFDDGFDSNAVEKARWFARTGDLQHTSTQSAASPSMATVADGALSVSATPAPDDPAFPYRTGYLETKGLFAQTYGKIEFRVRCQYAPGVWYAVWGRPWVNAVPEIDVEFLAENVNQVWFVDHWALPPARADERRSYVTVDGMDITAFHTYAITWTQELVEWQIDGKPYMRATGRGVPHEPMFWIMNAWVGGWGGTPSPSTTFPARFEVDYFRIYRTKEWATDPAIRIPRTAMGSTVGAGDTIEVELADFDRGARVEVWEGDALVASEASGGASKGTLLETMSGPPFRFRPNHLTKAAHALRFVGTDGQRTASANLDVVVR